MYRLVMGKISELSKQTLPTKVRQLAPQGLRRTSWLAGRALLSQMVYPAPLPDITYGKNGKPAFHNHMPFWFNISHSGNDIALLISDVGEVGCDIEVIRPRENWQRLANAAFSERERKEVASEPESRQLAAFWRIWTRKEAIVKLHGNTMRQLIDVDSTLPGPFFLNHYQSGKLSLAICTLTPFSAYRSRIR